MLSEQALRVIDTFFSSEPDAVRDGPDVEGLLRLAPEERAEAEEVLLHRLSPVDSRPATGLAALGCRRAAPLLQMLMEDAARGAGGTGGMFLANISAAMWRLEGSPEAAGHLRLLVGCSPYTVIRARAAQELSRVREPASVHALFAALVDQDMFVRLSAARSLTEMHGLAAEGHGLHPAVVRVAQADGPRARSDAARELRAIVEAAGMVAK